VRLGRGGRSGRTRGSVLGPGEVSILRGEGVRRRAFGIATRGGFTRGARGISPPTTAPRIRLPRTPPRRSGFDTSPSPTRTVSESRPRRCRFAAAARLVCRWGRGGLHRGGGMGHGASSEQPTPPHFSRSKSPIRRHRAPHGDLGTTPRSRFQKRTEGGGCVEFGAARGTAGQGAARSRGRRRDAPTYPCKASVRCKREVCPPHPLDAENRQHPPPQGTRVANLP